MTISLENIKNDLKAQHPILKRGSDETGYDEITGAEYDEIINSWADAAYAKELEAQQDAEAAAKREALLARLGITEEEARLLLS